MKVTTKKAAAVLLFLGSMTRLASDLTRIRSESWSFDRLEGLFAGSAAIFLFIHSTEAARARRKGGKRALDENVPEITLRAKLAAGVFGGFVGGLLGGLPFGVYYYFYALHPLALVQALGAVLENVISAIVIGIVIGAFTQLAIYFVRRKRQDPGLNWKMFVASLLAGAAGGVLLGVVGAGLIRGRESDPAGFGWAMGCLTLGACSIAFGAILYDHKLNWKSAGRALAIVFGIAAVAGLAGVGVFFLSGISFSKPETALTTGALTGLIAGAIMGMQIAGTEILYRVLNETPVKSTPSRRKRSKKR